jgi:hypothetical protein
MVTRFELSACTLEACAWVGAKGTHRAPRGGEFVPGLHYSAAATARVHAWSAGLRLRLGCAACAVAILLVIGAAPAEAHLIGINAMPTNYRTRILAVSPPIQGLEVRAAEIGGALELINRTGRQVIVLGARFEPYLRVEPDGGVDENRRSPTWLASRPPGSPPPRSSSVDPAAPPDWHRLSRGCAWSGTTTGRTGPALTRLRSVGRPNIARR